VLGRRSAIIFAFQKFRLCTVATMLAEMGVALDLVAAVVGHEAGGRETRTLVRHYVRTDLIERKRQVLRSWDERVWEIVSRDESTVSVAPRGRE
jgi:hypothetical protein